MSVQILIFEVVNFLNLRLKLWWTLKLAKLIVLTLFYVHLLVFGRIFVKLFRQHSIDNHLFSYTKLHVDRQVRCSTF